MKKFCLLPGFLLLASFSALAGSAGEEEVVDLQWAVCDAHPEAVLKKMDKDNVKGPVEGSVTYFDAESAPYLLDGVTFRLKTEEGRCETSVKIRFDTRVKVPEAACSWDRYGGFQTYTCEVAGEAAPGPGPWSETQAAFLRQRYHALDTGSLRSFGPFPSRKWRFHYKDQKVAFDTVDTGSAGQLMEFSLKAPASEADHLQEKFSAWLLKRDIVLCPRQESKTARLFRSLGVLRPGQRGP